MFLGNMFFWGGLFCLIWWRESHRKGYIQLEDLLWAPVWWDNSPLQDVTETLLRCHWHLFGTITYRGVSTTTHWTQRLSKTAPPVGVGWSRDGGQLVNGYPSPPCQKRWILGTSQLYMQSWTPLLKPTLLSSQVCSTQELFLQKMWCRGLLHNDPLVLVWLVISLG